MENQFKTLALCLLLAAGVASAQKREAGNLTFENVPVPDPQLVARLDRYENIRTAGFVGWDAKTDGLLVSTRFGNVPQIHHVARPGSYRQQLTFEREPVGSGSVCPDSSKNGFLFGMDTGGNENYQLYFFDRATGQKRLLTDGKSRHGGGVWSKKGEKFAYTSNRRSPGDLDIYVASLENPSDARMVFQGKGGGWGINDWSADDRQMLVSEYVSVNESRFYLLDMASGKLEQINPSAKQIAYDAERFSKDGKGIFFVSDEDSEFQQLRFYDFATKKIANLTTGINWDVQNFHQSEDGKHLIFSTNENGYTRVYLMDVSSRQYRPIPNLPDGIIGGLRFNRDNRRVAISVFSSRVPGDVFVLDIQTNAVERWTFGETGGLNVADFVEATLVQFPTFDKVNGRPRLIPAFLYLPKNVTGKVPVLIDIHGGPEGQSQPGFGSQTQFWAGELKVAVLRPNVRGSTGYGKTYAKLDNGVLRENSVKDIGALLDWIAKQPNLDAGRVAVFGGSYGGYMSLACMTHFNDRLRCGVDLFGISNFVTFLKNTSAYRQDLRRVEYGDERDPKMAEHLAKISPLTNIRQITKPMFVFQGRNDPRVPLSESQQMVEALKANGNTVWYVEAKDEGHGIAKKANRDAVNAAIAQFLEKNLIGEQPK